MTNESMWAFPLTGHKFTFNTYQQWLTGNQHCSRSPLRWPGSRRDCLCTGRCRQDRLPRPRTGRAGWHSSCPCSNSRTLQERPGTI